MISFASSSTSAETTDDFLGLNDTGIPITNYFSSIRVKGTRINHFVLIPIPLTMITHQDSKHSFTLDFDSDQLVAFSKTTIDMLRNRHEKVYPVPLVLGTEYKGTPVASSTAKPLGDEYKFNQCCHYIKNEKQFVPTFDVVGHGTPSGIGPLDPIGQVSPESFADHFDKLIIENKLSNLKTSRLNFIFHTCNSAFTEVNRDMSSDEILQSICENSFIGRFYQAMITKGYANLSVTGYRGYYSAMTSKSACSARLQDSFCSPERHYDLKHGEYTIKSGRCFTQATREKMGFPVQLVSRESMVDILEAKFSSLTM